MTDIRLRDDHTMEVVVRPLPRCQVDKYHWDLLIDALNVAIEQVVPAEDGAEQRLSALQHMRKTIGTWHKGSSLVMNSQWKT